MCFTIRVTFSYLALWSPVFHFVVLKFIFWYQLLLFILIIPDIYLQLLSNTNCKYLFSFRIFYSFLRAHLFLIANANAFLRRIVVLYYNFAMLMFFLLIRRYSLLIPLIISFFLLIIYDSTQSCWYWIP